jgi:hypothetical protein
MPENPVRATSFAGGVLTILVTVGVGGYMLLEGVALNPVNLITIGLALAAASVAVTSWADRRFRILAAVLLVVAILPTVPGGIFLLYLPSLVLLVVGGFAPTERLARR